MTIRPYTAADRNTCLDIFQSNTPQYFDPTEIKYLENWLNSKDENRNAYPENIGEHFYVLEDEGEVKGCGGFFIPGDSQFATMVWGMVHNQYHKQGLGKHLFQYRIDKVKELYPGYSIALDTTQHTYRFFEKLGFKVISIENNSYGPGLNRYDMILS